MADNFYITLPSNVKDIASSSAYTTELTDQIELDGAGADTSWEVALVGIQVPKTLQHIPDDHIIGLIININPACAVSTASDVKWWAFQPHTYMVEHDKEILEERKTKPTFKDPFTRSEISAAIARYKYLSEITNVTPKPRDHAVHVWFNKGSITSVEALIADINQIVRIMLHDLPATYDFMTLNKTTNRIEYLPRHPMIAVSFPPSVISDILGITKAGDTATVETEVDPQMVTRVGKYTVDLNNGVNTLFVYCDIIELERMNYTSVPLLRTVPIDNLVIDKPQYKKVIRSRISSIGINIRDLAGRPIKFTRGITICTLHFRRRGL